MHSAKHEKSLLLFDGVCALCNASVHFIIDRDPKQRFEFAPLQSPVAAEVLARFGMPQLADLRTLVLIEDGHCWTRSTAALRIARRLRGAWPLVALGIAIPQFLRDAIYDFIAIHRYRWFGKLESCRLPTPDTAGRFRG